MIKSLTQPQIERLTEEEFSMYLAYGESNDTLVYQHWDIFETNESVK
jgi:hypothetical protein